MPFQKQSFRKKCLFLHNFALKNAKKLSNLRKYIFVCTLTLKQQTKSYLKCRYILKELSFELAVFCLVMPLFPNQQHILKAIFQPNMLEILFKGNIVCFSAVGMARGNDRIGPNLLVYVFGTIKRIGGIMECLTVFKFSRVL